MEKDSLGLDQEIHYQLVELSLGRLLRLQTPGDTYSQTCISEPWLSMAVLPPVPLSLAPENPRELRKVDFSIHSEE